MNPLSRPPARRLPLPRLSASRWAAPWLHRLLYRLEGWKHKPGSPSPRPLSAHVPSRDLSFTFAVIALSAKVACADGRLTPERYIAFRESFPLRGGICAKIRELFALACRDETPCAHYVARINALFPQHPRLRLSLMERLFHIAAAGGEPAEAQARLLTAIAHGLGIGAADYAHIRARHHRRPLPTGKAALRILGVEPGTAAAALRKRYRELMWRYHPDRFAGSAVSPEVRLLLQLKASEINAAYQALRGG